MANLTLSIEGEVLRAARIRALEQGTSVNAVVRDYLRDYAGQKDAAEGIRRFLEIGARSGASSGPKGRTWTRDELHDR